MQELQAIQAELGSVFNALPGIYVLLLPDAPRFTVMAASDDYVFNTLSRRKDIIGKGLFESFIDHPKNETSDGPQNISRSLQKLIETMQPQSLNDQRFDLYNTQKNGFGSSVWHFRSKPVIREGVVQYIVLQAEERTERITMEATLEVNNIRRKEQGEQQVRAIIESAPFPIGVYIGREMRIQFLNQSIIDVWGKGPDIIGKTYFEVLPELEDQQIYEQLDQVYTSGIALHKRNQRVDLEVNGILQPFYFNYSFTPLFDDKGQVYGVMNTAADVTDLVMAKEQVEQSERNFRTMILQAPVAMCILLGPDHVVDIANKNVLQIWGKTADEVLGKPIFTALPEARNQGLEALLQDVYQKGITHKFDERPVSLFRNGKYETTYLNFVYQPYKDGQGNVLGVLVIANEVTEQVLSRRDIEQSTEELQMAISVAELGVFRVDLVENKATCSYRIMEWFGFDEQELDIEAAGRYIHEDDRQRVLDALKTTYASEEHSRHDLTYRVINGKDGTLRYVHSFGKTYIDSEGRPYAMVGMIQDISSQVMYQHQLEESEEALHARVAERTRELESQKNLLNNILVNSSNGISVSETIRSGHGTVIDARTILANDAAVRFTGLPRELYLTKTSKELDPHLFESDYGKTCLRTLETGQPAVMQYFLEYTGRWLELTISKMDDDHLIHIFTDVTPIKETQLQLERLVDDLKRSNANLEEFAYAASHDMKEPVRKMQFFSNRLREDLESVINEHQKRLFEKLENASQRMGILIDDLLTYSRATKGISEQETVDLNKKIKNVLVDLELQVQEKNAHIQLDPLPVVKGNSRQLQQLFQNLVNNALKYSRDDARPQIHIYSKTAKGRVLKPELPADEGEKLFHLIVVQDNGIGFDQKDAVRIFNLFTRLHGNAEYRGTGIGLSIARKVVENHKGFIWAESEPENGARFNIMLPAS